MRATGKLTSLVIAILLIGAIKSSGQDNYFTISGHIDTSFNKIFKTNELILARYSNYSGFSRERTEVRISVDKKNFFEAKIKLNDSLDYVSFEFEMQDGKSKWNVVFPKYRPFDEVYLFQPGDDIKMDIKPNGVITFKGKGCEKLTCQKLIYNIETIPESIDFCISKSRELNDLSSKLRLYDKSVKTAIDLKLTILEAYKNQFSENIYSLIYIDAISASNFAQYKQFLNDQYSFKGDANLVRLKDSYKNLDRIYGVFDVNLLASSAYYADALFQDEYNYFLLSSKTSSPRYADSFKEVYNHIISKFHGNLRDKLLFICFRYSNRYHSMESRLYLDEGIALIKDEKYKKLLISWKSKQTMAYPFEFYDVNDQVHSLEKYRGKLLVIDFWFNGCSNCIRLTSAMHEIVASYKNTKDVVFMTVSLDRKDVWLKGLKTGLYTSPGTINLYTNGLGFEHPLVKYYNFTSFPQQFIIGKQGELISTSPPRVDLKSNRDEFIKILNSNLLDKK